MTGHGDGDPTSTAGGCPHVDPYADAFLQDPYPTYAELRQVAPVYPVPGHDFTMVTTMELCRDVLRDPATYANSVGAARRSQPPAEVAAEVEAIRAQGFPYRPALGLNDPPSHSRYRQLINRAFTPRSLRWMEPLVESVAEELAASLPDGETVDLVAAVTRPLPIWAILRILGLPDDRRDDVARWSDAATASLGARLTPERWLEAERTNVEFQHVMSAELDARRVEPREDLLSALVREVPGETPMGNHELVWLVRELLVAGNETTTRTLADIVLRLDTRQEEWERIRTEPDRVESLVEEGLRLSTPAMGMFRRVTSDTTLGGVELPAETLLYLVYGSASRDEALFPEPDTFDPDRANAREHLAFGHGIHVCVGAGLARMEAGATLRALARHLETLRVADGASERYLPSFVLRGLVDLPVTVRRRQLAPTG